jgi:pimeloyl-ACP methyl ester carboxylesterase
MTPNKESSMRFLFVALSFFACTAFAEAHNFLARGMAVQAGPESNPYKARLYASVGPSYRSVIFLNPGGLIPALAMWGFAEALAQKNHIVFVLDNPNDLPLEAVTLAADLAAAFKGNSTAMRGLPAELQNTAVQSLPLRAIGHSLGGAVFGLEIGKSSSLFKEIILIGVSRLIATPERPAMKIRMLLGEKDGLASRAAVDQLAAKLQTQTLVIPGVNHFCIISDPDVGAPDKKAQDLPTELSREECIARVVAGME